MLNPEKYVRRPFYVDAVIVTVTNMEEVAKWCGGEILTEKQGGRRVKFIKVPVARPMSEKQTKAFVKDRVLKAETGFKVYTEEGFQKSFQPAPIPVDPTKQTEQETWVESDGMKGQTPLFEIVDEVTARELCGKTKYTIDHKPCLLDKDHGKRPCTSIELGPARTDNQIFSAPNPKLPANYPKPSSR